MSWTLIVLFGLFLFLMCAGLPIAFSVGLASIAALAVRGGMPMVIVPQRLFVSTDSFPLLAIPFFIVAGDVMLQGGISKRLINLANSLLGWTRGSLAYVTVVASAFFGAISGSAPATSAAIGGMMFPEMRKSGYDPDFSAFLGAISGTLGTLIPPSIALIIFGTQTGTSVGSLFIVSGVGGVILAAVYCLTAKYSIRNAADIVVNASRPTVAGVRKAFREAIWGLMSPLIILGGIYSGKFTATEAAVIAVVYSLFVGFFIYKELTIRNTIESIINSCITTGMVLILVAVASLFSWIMSVEGVARMLKALVTSFGLGPISFFLAVNVIYLVLGMFIETIPIVILTAPIFFPIASSLGINPIHFGVVTVFNLSYGMITPPFGINLFVASGYSKCKLFDMVRAGKYFYIVGLAMVIIYSFFPGLIMWSI